MAELPVTVKIEFDSELKEAIMSFDKRLQRIERYLFGHAKEFDINQLNLFEDKK